MRSNHSSSQPWLPRSKLAVAVFVVLTIFAAGGFSSRLGSETASAASEKGATPTPTASATPTVPAGSTSTATVTKTPTPEPGTSTATVTKTPTPNRSATRTPTPTAQTSSAITAAAALSGPSAGIDVYSQCSNDDGDGYGPPEVAGPPDTGCHWTNGNLQSNNSTYHEGDSTVQRLAIQDLITGDHTVTIQYGTTKGGKHAYDYITDDRFSETWVNSVDLCEAPITNFASCSSATVVNSGLIPADPNADGNDVINPSRHFQIRNGTWSNTGTIVAGIVSGPTLQSGSYAADSETIIQLKFHVDTATCLNKYVVQNTDVCEVLITFGAHISSSLDWAPELTAVNIPGSPYHVAIVEMDGSSIGQRDNQMQAGAVVLPGTIVIIKDAVPNDAQNFAYTTSGTGLSGFSLDDDADPTLSNTQTFLDITPGSYTVQETLPVPGWSLTALSCTTTEASGDTTTTNPATGLATIDLDPCETVTCT
jgi:hypothetical protein